MKHIGLLAFALLLMPGVAAAQSAQDGPPMPPQDGGATAGMQSPRAQMAQLRMETRSQMLGALTQQHRALLANVVGQLATSQAPNLQAAARQLDSALSQQESDAIVQAETALRSQMRGGMQGGPGGNGPPGGNGGGQPAGAQGAPPAASGRAPDAGMALLRMALAVGGSARAPQAP